MFPEFGSEMCSPSISSHLHPKGMRIFRNQLQKCWYKWAGCDMIELKHTLIMAQRSFVSSLFPPGFHMSLHTIGATLSQGDV